LRSLCSPTNDTKKTETVADLVESALGDAVSSEELEFREEDVKVEAPIIKLANKIIVDALKMRASDIHIEPYDKGVSVRYRIDGVLHKSLNLPLQIKRSLITRFKIMAHLDISEKDCHRMDESS